MCTLILLVGKWSCAHDNVQHTKLQYILSSLINSVREAMELPRNKNHMQLLVNTGNSHGYSCQSNDHEAKLILKAMSNRHLIKIVIQFDL